jgi:hypothetical protein
LQYFHFQTALQKQPVKYNAWAPQGRASPQLQRLGAAGKAQRRLS